MDVSSHRALGQIGMQTRVVFGLSFLKHNCMNYNEIARINKHRVPVEKKRAVWWVYDKLEINLILERQQFMNELIVIHLMTVFGTC